MRRSLVSAAVVTVLLAPAAARAAELAPRPCVFAFELGLIDSPRHLTYAGADGGVFAPPEYAGVVFDGRVLPHLHVDGQAGFNFVEGWMASLSARLAAEVSRLTISIGVGPLVATGNWSGPPAPYADADASAILHFEGPLVLLFRAGAAWALSDRGNATCGIDTCDSHLVRGDRIIFARLGIGSSF
jgi:hypothetical protein